MIKFKQSTILLASLLSIFSLNISSISANNNINSSNFYDDVPSAKQSPLGAAQYFHIFSKNANLYAHTNGNVATNNLNGSVNFGTNIHEGLVPIDISYIQKFSNISSSSFVSKSNNRTNKVVFGPSVTIKDHDMNNSPRVSVNNINLDHLSGSEIYSDNKNNYLDIDTELAKVTTKAKSWLQHADSNTTPDYSDFNNRRITVSNTNNENIAYISIATSELLKNTPIKIYGESAVAPFLIINVIDDLNDPSTTVNINSKIEYYFNGTLRNNHETEYFEDSKLLINFSSINGKSININSPFQGTIVAPQDKIIANQNIDGSLIADTVTINSETHRWDINSQDIRSDSKVPDTTTPNSKVPDTTTSDSKVPDTTTPDSKVPDTTTPDSKVPDTTTPDSKLPD
ncbi:collagen-binding domain-containing protein, partial [Weissella cibaria]|uniref:collagen-binding domain-containing protein n=1 Tax=Weissella cibaria TaxID=137591 RepID=UPI00359C1FFA|nr:hypothetical protein [Weissella cibaria]